MRIRHLSLPLTLCLALALSASAADTRPALVPGPAPEANEIEALVRAKSFDRAIARVDELRAAAPTHVADAESEYWGGKAAQSLGANDEARTRLRQMAKVYPDAPRAADAMIEAAMLGVDVPKGHTTNPKEREAAATAAHELEGIAPTLTKSPGSASRAWFVAGNAWRIAEDDAKARADYEKAKAIAVGDYPMKAQHMLAMLAGRRLDAEEARTLLSDCMLHSTDAQQERCRKDVDRWSVVGSPAPPLEVETWIHGEPQSLEALHGNVVLLWFFATWCPHCKATMPEMAGLEARLKGKPFRIIGVTKNDQDQTTESAKAFVADPQWKIDYPIAVDKGGTSSDAFHASAVPSAILIDKKGVVRWAQHPGYLSDALIDKLVAE